MNVTDISALRAQLNLPDTGEDALLWRQLDAAHRLVEQMLGLTFEDIAQVQHGIPAPLAEAVLRLAAWFYEQREAGIVGSGAAEVPFGVREIVREYREFTF